MTIHLLRVLIFSQYRNRTVELEVVTIFARYRNRLAMGEVGISMYHKLARGYATAYLSKKRPSAAVESWFDSPKRQKALDVFEESARSKKPGRCEKRLAPILRPAFLNPMVCSWTKPLKLVMAETVGSAQECDVFSLGEAEAPLYQERSIFFSNLFLSKKADLCRIDLVTVANISHHAITRLLEREVATPDTLHLDILGTLSIARDLALTYHYTSLDKDRPHAFLVPYFGGALPIATMRVRTNRNRTDEHIPVMSVRTYLGPDMLRPEHHERMGGFEAAMSVYSELNGSKSLTRWMEVNARPWSMTSDASVSPAGQGPSSQAC